MGPPCRLGEMAFMLIQQYGRERGWRPDADLYEQMVTWLCAQDITHFFDSLEAQREYEAEQAVIGGKPEDQKPFQPEALKTAGMADILIFRGMRVRSLWPGPCPSIFACSTRNP